MARYPCRHIEQSPLLKGFLPRANSKKALAYLYCLDLAHGMVRLDENKTDDPRA